MGASYLLADHLYVSPTPGGAFYAVATPGEDPPRRLIRALLAQSVTPRLGREALSLWMGLNEPEQALALLNHIQDAHWLQGFEAPRTCPSGSLEALLPGLLQALSSQGKALLADNQGFYLATSGFPHETAEELSALSAELASLHERRTGLLLNNMGLNSSAWAVVDASGGSRLGFWPLYIGAQRFVLVIAGLPRFNQPDFLSLVWALSQRYGDEQSHVS
ncbi:hypothetical protein [Methylococcus sp. EFPC2]|uniref:hypothetical protein n=1 Tax=Methylococcus sp. EFPC2 TaxID=2812648 RepID=UPI00196872B4|nr:hypothetical protein [Methylococcus sp. EFPC2]QSA96268.1 hypothetical protein JWZ97_13680 [Methylococcus sp. EFPC2]